jgi:AcrR family transcriptional regulator
VSTTVGSGGHPYAELSRGLLRDHVLDAVGALVSDRPWAKVTMADVSERAGVSRQTLYNAFGTRSELAQAYVDREANRFLAAVDEAVREHAAEPRAALEAALDVFLAAAGAHPLVRAITGTDGSEELLRLVTTGGGPLVGLATQHLTELLVETWPELERRDAAAVGDALVRLAISYAALPAGAPAETAKVIARLLEPCVRELLG